MRPDIQVLTSSIHLPVVIYLFLDYLSVLFVSKNIRHLAANVINWQDQDSSGYFSLKQLKIVGIATCYWLDCPGIESQWGVSLSSAVRNGRGAHSVSYDMSTGSLPGSKAAWAGR